jgi:hypothetical protein
MTYGLPRRANALLAMTEALKELVIAKVSKKPVAIRFFFFLDGRDFMV